MPKGKLFMILKRAGGIEMEADTQLRFLSLWLLSSGRPQEQKEGCQHHPAQFAPWDMNYVGGPQHHPAYVQLSQPAETAQAVPSPGKTRAKMDIFARISLVWISVSLPQWNNSRPTRVLITHTRVHKEWQHYGSPGLLLCKASHPDKGNKGRNMGKFTPLCVASCKSV